MKKRWRIVIYIFTHLGLVISILFLNLRKKQNSLLVTKAIFLNEENGTYSNQIQIQFKQQGAILVVVQNKFVYPIIKNEGALVIPSNLLNSKVINLSFVGLFQSQIKRIEISDLPIQTRLITSSQKYRSKFRKVKPILMNTDNITTVSNMFKRPKVQKNDLRLQKLEIPKLSRLPKLKNTKVISILSIEEPHTLNCEGVKQELKNRKNEK